MESGKTHDRQPLLTSLKRTIFIGWCVEIILFLLALDSFLQGGWFVLFGALLLLAFCVVIGYLLFWLLTTSAVQRAKTVEIDDPPPGTWGRGSFRLTFGKKYDPSHSDVD